MYIGLKEVNVKAFRLPNVFVYQFLLFWLDILKYRETDANFQRDYMWSLKLSKKDLLWEDTEIIYLYALYILWHLWRLLKDIKFIMMETILMFSLCFLSRIVKKYGLTSKTAHNFSQLGEETNLLNETVLNLLYTGTFHFDY